MLLKPLPYPGYSWSFSQHAAGFDEATIKGMLTCALPFQGVKNPGPKITELMIKLGLLTPNERDGKEDAWRDYQQILSELGLIVSTKLKPEVTLTEVAMAYIAGDVSFQQLMTMQVLRYQYPNGQKHDRSSALKTALASAGISDPESLIKLQNDVGISVKPGLLILQVLLNLLKNDDTPQISVDECRAFLLPCKSNEEAEEATNQIRQSRALRTDLTQVNAEKRVKRNTQDWFKLLGHTGLFATDGSSYIELSPYALSELGAISDLITSQLSTSSFWTPSGIDQASRRMWFSHFGNYDPNFEILQVAANTPANLSIEFSKSDHETHDDEPAKTSEGIVRLTPYNKDDLFNSDAPIMSEDMELLAARIKDGAIKRHAKTILHDQIVSCFAERFLSQGAKVDVDPNSVDLFATWPDGNSALFEVKTVTYKSLQQRIRIAVGQVKEYAFRLERETKQPVDTAIIIDRKIAPDHWLIPYLTDYLGIGLICLQDDDITLFPPEGSKSSIYW